MKNLKGMAVLAGLLMLFAVPAAAVSIADSVAVVTDHSGNARIYTAGAWKNAEINMPLYEGDAIKTLKESALEITFDDATIVKLGDNTELKLTELKRQGATATTVFNLLKGKFLAIVDKLKNPESRFEVHTKMAIAAVKGTELALEADDSITSLGVFTGAVEFMGPNGGSVKGKYKVIVEKGNESGCGSSGDPTKPSGIRFMGKFEREFGNLRETVKLVRELKEQGGDAVYKWRIKKKLEKDGKVIGESETEGTIGGTNKNVGDVKNKLQNALKEKMKKGLINEKSHAYKDLKFVNEEMNADLHLGKTMTDVHGNRVRMEEFVFRPAENQIDMLSITLRDKDKVDYLRLENVFNQPIPESPTRDQWRSMWARTWYLTVPENSLREQRVKMSNMIDWVFIGTYYNQPINIAGALPVFVLPKVDEILAFSNLYAGAAGIANEVEGDMTTRNFIDTPYNNQFVREHRVYMAPMSDGTQLVKRGKFDKTFDTFGNYSTVMAQWGVTAPGISSNAFVPYSQPNTMAEGVVQGDIAMKHTRNYNDGSWLAMNMYLIDDYGNPMTVNTKNFWSLVWSIDNIVRNSNVEIMMKSNEFLDQEAGIDVVSKLLWWIILNPQNVNNKTPNGYVYSN